MGHPPAELSVGDGAPRVVREGDHAVVLSPERRGAPEEVVRPRRGGSLVKPRVLDSHDLVNVVGGPANPVGPVAHSCERCRQPARLLVPRLMEPVNDPRLHVERLGQRVVVHRGHVVEARDVMDSADVDECLNHHRDVRHGEDDPTKSHDLPREIEFGRVIEAENRDAEKAGSAGQGLRNLVCGLVRPDPVDERERRNGPRRLPVHPRDVRGVRHVDLRGAAHAPDLG